MLNSFLTLLTLHSDSDMDEDERLELSEKKEKEEEEYDPLENMDMSDYLSDDGIASYKLRGDSYGNQDDEVIM